MYTQCDTTNRKHLLSLVCLGLTLLLLPTAARAGDFIDTRITFTIGDDNFLNDAGEQLPDSPLFGIGDRPGYEQPYDNLDMATSGRENELHLVLYKKVEGILPGLTTEVAAALEIDLAELEARDPQLYKVFSDDSSYIRLKYAIDADRRGDRYLDLVLFPLSGDRFRAGYLYDLTWGGKDIFRKRKGPTPAFKLGGNHGMFYWWGGMKFVLSPTTPDTYMKEDTSKKETTEWETLYGALAGAGVQPIKGLSIDISGGHLQIARNPVEQVPDMIVTTSGFSARVAYGQGLDVGLSADLRLLRNDPEYLQNFSRRPKYSPGSGFNWRVAAEANAIIQVLADPDRTDASKRQWATAAAVDLRMQYDYLRANLTGVYRSTAFTLLNVPSVPSYRAFSEDAIVAPQIFFALSADYHFPRLHLTPGIQGGVEFPAAYKTEWWESIAGANPSSAHTGSRTILFPTSSTFKILADDKDRLPVYSWRLTARWYPSEILTLMAFVLFVYDNNAAVLKRTAESTFERVYDEPFRLGAGVTAQARF